MYKPVVSTPPRQAVSRDEMCVRPCRIGGRFGWNPGETTQLSSGMGRSIRRRPGSTRATEPLARSRRVVVVSEGRVTHRTNSWETLGELVVRESSLGVCTRKNVIACDVYSSRCSIPFFETLASVISSGIHPGLLSGASSSQAHPS